METITTGVGWVDSMILWAAAIAALCGALFTIAKAVRAAIRVGRKVDRLATQLLGDDETPSLDARLSNIEHELHPNSGSSMRDAVDRTERALSDHVEQSKVLLEAGKGTETELRKAISDIAAALPTIAESTPPQESQ
jgi:hypothetical protein